MYFQTFHGKPAEDMGSEYISRNEMDFEPILKEKIENLKSENTEIFVICLNEYVKDEYNVSCSYEFGEEIIHTETPNYELPVYNL